MSDVQNLYYNLSEVLLDGPELPNPVDITATVYELSLTETVDRGFVAGNITILDDKRVYENIKFTGIETVTVSVTYNEMTNQKGEEIIRKTFYLRNKRITSQANERAQVVIFDLVEDHGFIDNTFKISRCYSGTGPDIIRNILATLNKDLDDTTFVGEFPPAQTAFKYIPPFLNPLTAAYTIKDRMTSLQGSPFFLSGSVFRDTIDLISFDAVMASPPDNTVFPFLYSESNVNFGTDPNKDGTSAAQARLSYLRHFVVGEYQEEDLNDTFALMKHGAIYNDYETFDIFNGKEYDARIFIGDQLKRMKDLEILRGKTKSGDYQTVLNENAIGDFENNTNETYSIVSGKTFPDLNNIHDVNSAAQANKKVQPLQLLNALESNAVMISVRGFGVMQYKISAGDSIAMVYLRTSEIPEEGLDTEDLIDERRSGHFIVLETKHIFRLTDHIVNMKVSKVSTLPPQIKEITLREF